MVLVDVHLQRIDLRQYLLCLLQKQISSRQYLLYVRQKMSSLRQYSNAKKAFLNVLDM